MNVKKRRSSFNLKQNTIDGISLWGAIGLLWCSFISIIREFFPKFVGENFFLIVLFLFVLWTGYDFPKKYLKKLTLPCQLAGILIPVGYVFFQFEKIVDGFIGISSYYLHYFNIYYKTNLSLGEASNAENIVIAFTALSMLLWWLVWVLAYGWKKRILLVLFPILALSVLLAVGLSPFGNGLFLMFFAAMLLTTLGGSSLLKKGVVLASVGLSIIFSGIFFGLDIEELATEEKKQELISWQNNINWDSVNIFKWIQLDFHFNREQLGNNSPEYTGKTVLEIECDDFPVSTLYLKGFYATNYKGGSWTYDDSAFREACRKAGKSQEEVAKMIFQMPYERVSAYNEKSPLRPDITYKISYVSTTGDVAYVPYASDYAALDEEYELMGDYLFKKSILDKEIQVVSKNESLSIGNFIAINNAVLKGYGKYEDDLYSSVMTPSIQLSDQMEDLEFINSLSSAYLQVPENAKYIKDAGKTLAEMMSEIEEADRIVGILYERSDNYRRLRYAEVVIEYLHENMSYSLMLDNLPAGTDPIEYALTVSHEGYCMHFASAATLLLRDAGVPARYVSGYAVKRSAFHEDEETGKYKAEVGDYMAHAWVEIYLDNIGWIPVEVTPGSSLESLPTREEIYDWEVQSNAHKQELENPKDPSENTENNGSQSEVEDTQTESEDSQTTEEAPSQSQDQDSQTPSQSQSQNSETETSDSNGMGTGNGSNSQVWKELLILVAIFFSVIIVVLTVRYSILCYHRALQKEMKKNMTRKAVKRMNRRVYRILRMRKPSLWLARSLSDVAYEATLVELYKEKSRQEWSAFMAIVKKNHYSNETITTEEMQYCYECYKIVKLIHFTHKEKK